MTHGKITVVNKYKHDPTHSDIYIGRGSHLGNPYTHLASSHPFTEKVETREEAIEMFKVYFEQVINLGEDCSAYKQLDSLISRVKNGEDINLVCFCKPKSCHGDTIKEYIESKL